MTRSLSPRLPAYVGLAGLGLLAALVTGRAELAALAAPFLLVVVIGLVLGSDPEVQAEVRVSREHLLEGDEVELEVELSSRRPVERLELLVVVPDRFTVLEGDNPALLRLGREPRAHTLRLRADRWGGFVLGRVHLRARDLLGLTVHESHVRRLAPTVKVYPHPEELRGLLRPAETQLFSGDELSRRKGEGIEFADVRPFHFGDRVRRVNWRASARRNELWVNEQHPERNMDVVLFLDSFAEARRGAVGTIDLAVRAAASLAARYVRRRDRVGLVSFGGVLRWLMPGTGLVQMYRIVDALLDTEITLNWAWKDIDVVPARTLPPQALVVALSPLLDERSVRALLDLRARGFDLAVVEVSPVPFVDPPPGETGELAFRLWQLRRDALRGQYLSAGVAVAEWHEGEPLTGALHEVGAFRRHARLARA